MKKFFVLLLGCAMILAWFTVALAEEASPADAVIKLFAAKFQPQNVQSNIVALLAPPTALKNPPTMLAATTISRTHEKVFFNLGLRLVLGSMLAGQTNPDAKQMRTACFDDSLTILKGIGAPDELIKLFANLKMVAEIGDPGKVKANLETVLTQTLMYAKDRFGKDGAVNFGFGVWVGTMLTRVGIRELDPQITDQGKLFSSWLQGAGPNTEKVRAALAAIGKWTASSKLSDADVDQLLNQLEIIVNYYS